MRRWILVILVGSGASVTFVVVLVWRVFGLYAASLALACIGAVVGLARFLLEVLKQLKVLPPAPAPWLWFSFAFCLLCGTAAGYFVVFPLVEPFLRPSVAIHVSNPCVEIRQRVGIDWRNVPPSHQIRLLVYEEHTGSLFLQKCHPPAIRSGRMDCEVEIGGTLDNSKHYEVRAVLADSTNRELDEALANSVGVKSLVSTPLMETVPVRRCP